MSLERLKKQFYDPRRRQAKTTTESGLQRLRREQAEKEQRQLQREEQARRSQHAQITTPKGC